MAGMIRVVARLPVDPKITRVPPPLAPTLLRLRSCGSFI
jgi:hypothetical protein